MALSEDLRTRVVEAVVAGGLSRNAAAKRFGVSIASAIRWVWRFQATGEISPAPTGGDRRSDRIEAHGDYLLGLIRRQPDITLLEIQERLIANCSERFSLSVEALAKCLGALGCVSARAQTWIDFRAVPILAAAAWVDLCRERRF